MKKQFINPGILILLLLIMVTFIACIKDIDLNSDKCHDLHTFLKAKNTRGSCGNKAAFEDKKICLCGYLSYEKDPENGHLFAIELYSSKHEESRLNVGFESSIRGDLMKYLESNRGKKASLNALVNGFDKPYQFRCIRGYEMHIEDPSEIVFE